MAAFSRLDRLLAAGIALLAWAGLAVKVGALLDEGLSAARAAWIVLRYFTELTSIGIALMFTALALGWYRFANQSLQTGVTVSSGLVLVSSYWLLGSPFDPAIGVGLADALLGIFVPIAALVFWFERLPKGGLALRDPFLWITYPLVYLDYAILRGAAESNFAYHFMNGIEIGWEQTFWTALLILSCFLDASLALVWLDPFLGKLRNRLHAGS